MKKQKVKFITPVITLLLASLACGVPSLVPTAEPLPSPSPTWTLLPVISEAPTVTLTPSLTPSEEAPGPTETPTEKPFNCPNAPATRVKVGENARVTFTDGLPLRLREKPEVANNVLAQISEGTEFTILDGPRCAPLPDSPNSFVFWQIELNSTGFTGWVAEGDLSSYYIEPLP